LCTCSLFCVRSGSLPLLELCQCFQIVAKVFGHSESSTSPCQLSPPHLPGLMFPPCLIPLGTHESYIFHSLTRQRHCKACETLQKRAPWASVARSGDFIPAKPPTPVCIQLNISKTLHLAHPFVQCRDSSREVPKAKGSHRGGKHQPLINFLLQGSSSGMTRSWSSLSWDAKPLTTPFNALHAGLSGKESKKLSP
jgi:hypothetical protein